MSGPTAFIDRPAAPRTTLVHEGALMGIENVQLTWARWNHLPATPFRLLQFMALKTMDDDDPPTFWAGREALAYGVGRMTPPEPAATDTSERAEMFREARTADFQAVKRALSVLTEAGVISVERRQAPGRNAVYALHLGRSTGYGDRTGQGTKNVPLGYGERTEQGTVSVPRDGGVGGVTFVTIEEQEGSSRGTKSPYVTTSLVAAPDYAEAAKLLDSMPDKGGKYMARITESESVAQQVILAAMLAKSEMAS